MTTLNISTFNTTSRKLIFLSFNLVWWSCDPSPPHWGCRRMFSLGPWRHVILLCNECRCDDSCCKWSVRILPLQLTVDWICCIESARNAHRTRWGEFSTVFMSMSVTISAWRHVLGSPGVLIRPRWCSLRVCRERSPEIQCFPSQACPTKWHIAFVHIPHSAGGMVSLGRISSKRPKDAPQNPSAISELWWPLHAQNSSPLWLF